METLPKKRGRPRGTGKKNRVLEPTLGNEESSSRTGVGSTDAIPTPVPIFIPSATPLTHAHLEEKINQLKEQKLRLLTMKKNLMKDLPHRHGFKWFKWQREFFEATEKDVFLTAANQVGKSTINIATAIEWAGNTTLWPKLWPGRTPRQIWYLYPESQLATSEFKTKWIPDLLPKESLKDDPQWGWRAEYLVRNIHAVHFNSGCSIYFKFYSQDIMNLQGSTVAAIFTDEELREVMWDELNQRRLHMNGYFRMVFTATIGQRLWYDTMERQGTPQEKFPHARKFQISLYDCKEFEDGTPSYITDEYIKKAVALCKNEAEVQKRIMGRFSMESGLKYASFDRSKNIVPPHEIPKEWFIYVGVDVGSGGTEENAFEKIKRERAHPSAVTMCALSPDGTQVRVFDGWHGQGKVTTDMDVLQVVEELISKHNCRDRLGGIFYDHSAKDFGTIAARKGMAVMKADKSRDAGESVLNVLFKNQAMMVFDIPQLDELIYELTNLKHETRKSIARDDYVDSLRYALSRAPINWEKLGVTEYKAPIPVKAIYDPLKEEIKARRSGLQVEDKGVMTIEQELNAWEEYYDF